MGNRIIVAVAALIFIVYCFGVAGNIGKVPLPRYHAEVINALGEHAFSESFNHDDPRFREHIRGLARHNYLAMPANHNANFADPNQVLNEEALLKITADQPDAARHLTVVSQDEIQKLAHLGYKFAEDTNVGGTVFKAGTELDVGALTALARDGKRRDLKVSGSGVTISLQPGTMLMIIIIFIGLLCALKIILFDPLVKIIDERDAEIESGELNRREISALVKNLDAEVVEERAEIRRQRLNTIAQARRTVTDEASEIVKKAHEEARRAHELTASELRQAQKEAEEKLAQEVSPLAQQIVGKVLSA
ncbi:hypothetical protein AGMMS49959_18320 [Planctomycetales bacterium]|nr:hypothetical protein AGMMS49959_18320 [Planctomycetales bacterium]